MHNRWVMLTCMSLILVAGLEPLRAQENIFPKMVGKWREINTAVTIIIENDGSVFSNTGLIRGSVARTIEGGGNFAFENESTKCVYDIIFLGAPLLGAASWGLKSEKVPNSCVKTGTFVKVLPDVAVTEKSKTEQDSDHGTPTVPPSSVKDTDKSPKKIPLDIPAVDTKQLSKNVNQDVEEAKKNKPSANPQGPQELTDINIVYFDHKEDEDIKTILTDASISFSTRKSESQGESNTLTCTPDVPIAAIRKILRTLLDAGVPIRSVEKSMYPDLPRRITIENYGGNINSQPIISSSDIENIDHCGIDQRIFFQNNCPKGPVDVNVVYYDKMSKKWLYESEIDINLKEIRKITDKIGKDVRAIPGLAYFYAKNNGNLIWPGKEISGLTKVIPDESGENRLFKVINQMSKQGLNCTGK